MHQYVKLKLGLEETRRVKIGRKVRAGWCAMIYLLTATDLTPGGSSTVHIYTGTIHRTKNDTEFPDWNIHNNKKTYCTKLNRNIQNIQRYTKWYKIEK